MKVYHITKDDLNENNEYIGKLDLSKIDGHLEADKNLGYVKVKKLTVSGYIYFEADSGIKAGWGIEAGEGIKAGWGIEAGEGIKAGWGIEAGEGIKAGWGIKAGEGIEAGWGIEAGEGIKAGLHVYCEGVLSFGYRLFAGTATWKKEVSEDEMTVECGKLEKGKICYGVLKENGLKEDGEPAKAKAKELRSKAEALIREAEELETSAS